MTQVGKEAEGVMRVFVVGRFVYVCACVFVCVCVCDCVSARFLIPHTCVGESSLPLPFFLWPADSVYSKTVDIAC